MNLVGILAQQANTVITLYLLINFGEYYGQVMCAEAD